MEICSERPRSHSTQRAVRGPAAPAAHGKMSGRQCLRLHPTCTAQSSEQEPKRSTHCKSEKNRSHQRIGSQIIRKAVKGNNLSLGVQRSQRKDQGDMFWMTPGSRLPADTKKRNTDFQGEKKKLLRRKGLAQKASWYGVSEQWYDDRWDCYPDYGSIWFVRLQKHLERPG